MDHVENNDERRHLLNAKDVPIPSNNFNAGVFVLVLSGISIALVIAFSNFSVSPSHYISAVVDTDDANLIFTLNRVGYDSLVFFSSDSDSVLSYSLLDNYDAVVEPSAEMELDILSDVTTRSTSNVYYKYRIYSTSDYNTLLASGDEYPNETGNSTSFSLACNPYDEFSILITKFIGDEPDSKQSGTALCLYVRREVRALSSKDLNATLDAMYSLWSYSEEDGQALFGDNFHNANYFAEIHNFNAAWQDADHIHEGLGFIPQHIKMTNMFEMAMQAVDPSVSLFFWDFTIDDSEGKKVFDSFVFQESIFGTLFEPASPSTGWTYADDVRDNGRITNGRWANLKAEKSVKYPDLANGYGYMRGPWNMNPSEYVMRFSANFPDLPGCSSYEEWLETTDFNDFMKLAAYGPHSTTHSAIGGVYGCDVFDPLLAAGLITDSTAQVDICQKWGFWIKELYRGYYLTPDTNCSADALTCAFTCDDDKADQMLTLLKSTITLNEFVPSDLTSNQWEQWRDFICTGDAYKVFVGDHLESASPSDPSFWPIHPTQERLVHAKYLSGWFDDDSWPTSANGGAYVCNHNECYENSESDKSYNDFCCYGHFEFDQFLDFISGNRSQFTGPTNAEIMSAMDASSSDYSMPYIYSDFDWTHCGMDFEQIAIGLLTNSLRRRS